MKLWIVAQWGNEDEGGDGEDTNCIVRAPDLEMAVKLAENEFEHLDWKDGQSDVVMFLGDDCLADEKSKVIVRTWRAHALNIGNYPSWHRNLSGKWITSVEMFGDKDS